MSHGEGLSHTDHRDRKIVYTVPLSYRVSLSYGIQPRCNSLITLDGPSAASLPPLFPPLSFWTCFSWVHPRFIPLPWALSIFLPQFRLVLSAHSLLCILALRSAPDRLATVSARSQMTGTALSDCAKSFIWNMTLASASMLTAFSLQPPGID